MPLWQGWNWRDGNFGGSGLQPQEGRVVRREGDPLEVAQWLQACHDAGMEVRVQINESAAP
ncbi:hypothetical protein AI2852V1_4666 (plasmid) [Escherichia coli]|nr:hypothetical protein AI2852V1_4666 [Escherichia coli]CAF2554062.1 hypothetical protein AI2853V1_4675 [Escherichia coli]CAH5540809.1 hypothetical protein AI2852V1_4666 [Escherichia coli]CAH5578408.1 hypothetical protein AI2853V1_4675 [Escherichia coli]